MICYKDRWWCNRWEKCKKGEGCDRALTPAVTVAAEEWWGKPGVPFSICSPTDCFEDKDEH